MNHESSRTDFASPSAARNGAAVSRCVRFGLATTLGVSLALCRPDFPRAQQRFKEPAVRVTGVAASGGVVSISADGPLNRAQTWHDSEGFHVVLVNGQTDLRGSAGGVKVRRVGNSLELVVPVKSGAGVTVQPRGNRLDLVISGGASNALNVENFVTESRDQNASTARQPKESAPEQSAGRSAPAAKRRGAELAGDVVQPAARQPERKAQPALGSAATAEVAPRVATHAGAQPAANGSAEGATPAPEVAKENLNVPATPPNVLVAPAQMQSEEGGGFGSLLFSLSSLLTLAGVGLLGALLFLARRRRKSAEDDWDEEGTTWDAPARKDAQETAAPFSQFKGDRRQASIAVPFERRRSGRGAEDEASRQLKGLGEDGAAKGEQPGRVREAKVSGTSVPSVQFGAYRIDQEIGHLVSGESHSVEVLSSRAADDRRAIESSLLKALRSTDLNEDGRRLARMALEDYGFVARSCAALLLGGESFERASAARALGEMRSAQALPFLTEALYDVDPVVRTESVRSLGALGLPSAIGAMLDVARRHPDIPASILSPALTACSVESLELYWSPSVEGGRYNEAAAGAEFTGEIRSLEPVAEYDELPEWIEDEGLQYALGMTGSADAESRVQAAQQLAQFQAGCAVGALAALATRDAEPAVRAAAVTALGVINHESVFVPVIEAMADESREVRAAAARALSRLSLDRADAYVRVLETSDEQTLREVAQACVRAGLASQAINRLASEDRRQAYEAFSLISLVIKAGETQVVLDTVENHRDIEVRLACIRLLALSLPHELVERLQRLAEDGSVPEKVRLALLETVGHADQPQPVAVA